MSPIQFVELNLVGCDEIDNQHRTWIDIFNKLEGALVSRESTVESDFQQQILKEILDFTRLHFATEEDLMHKYGYPGAARHRRFHKDFDQQIYENYRRVMEGEAILNSELLKILRNWFLNHTSSEDRTTFQYINAEKAKRDEA